MLSSDQHTFEVDEAVALQSVTLKLSMEDIGTEETIPVPNVDSKILAKVIEYCTFHCGPAASQEVVDAWDARFMEEVDRDTLFSLIVVSLHDPSARGPRAPQQRFQSARPRRPPTT